MSKVRLVAISAIALALVSAAPVRALDISAKSIAIKDASDTTKRQVKVQSADAGVLFTDADDPGMNGASLHVYSATDDFCIVLPAGADWQSKGGKWKYKSKATKNAAQVKDARLSVKIRSGITFSLADDAPQGTVNVQLQFGTGTRYCMRCSGNKKDDAKKFIGKACAAAPCDAEPSACGLGGPTTTSSTATTTSTVTTSSAVSTTTVSTTSTVSTTTVVTTTSTVNTSSSVTTTSALSTTTQSVTTTTTTTSTTTTTVAGIELRGALPATSGRFNYNLTLGLPGANAACNSSFPGTHACTYAELQTAEAAGDLDGLKSTNGQTVTSFWVIDGTHNVQVQCIDDTVGGSNQNWEYATAHTGTAGEKVNLNNGTGALGPLMSGFADNVFCAGSSWVGCCL